ncbi:hypothetical protein IX317_001638 [Fusobacterium sp. DD29]|uniref:helix-turn-helix domain-containing protein n=1 Tax=unclassified Fusobacterium TaxID=2648384 RepID=UPI001B8BAA31|nr:MULTISPECIES: helix-turn-helix transcriptional regulator [unclassified Fusobacterium]MBR8702113.1 hypothetical protein [Fusobacterium sp. DD45]MBR8711928.1 hypothetical protein [Fusobacterium sp. DD28]MBR8749958.1 hypothetical protein [Fusobacterium sp. DD29]MBR8752501.1 hypothetical protein [Fusobacterium sp. DD26]MBR8762229.1 hypothetical protein [Fusobacterium sp. DD25]
MDKIMYYFKKNNIDLKFIESTQKFGINKNNECTRLLNDISLYKFYSYILGVKRSGRCQYLLFDDAYHILINEVTQTAFLKKLDNFLTPESVDDTIINIFIKQLREKNKITRKELAAGIDKSIRSIMAYENLHLNITVEILESILKFLNISLENYKKEFETYLKTNNLNYLFHDFQINRSLMENQNKKEVKDLVPIKRLTEKYNIKLSLIYRYSKIANESMKEDNYKIVKGKVSLKKFDEIYTKYNRSE